MRTLRTLTGAGIGLALAFAAFAAPAAAQVAERPTHISAGGDPNQEDLVIDWAAMQSRFNLRAEGDEGGAGVRSNGQSTNCMTNTGFEPGFDIGCWWSGQVTRRKNGSMQWKYFGINIGWSLPPSDMPSVIDPVASGLLGGGYTSNITSTIVAMQGGTTKIWASDRSGAELLAFGVKVTEDASCTNFTALRDGGMQPGAQLLPVSTCPPTHPPAGFAALSAHPIEEDAYLELFQSDPTFRDGDPFAFWRVPADKQRLDKQFGDWQTFGEYNDYYFQAKERYGSVIPGGSGSPVWHGWPAGLEVKFDGFYFGLPSVGGTTYWQATIVNNSEKVYGQGFDYDSIYLALNYDPGDIQSSAHYFDPDRSAIMWNNTSGGCAGQPVPPGSGCPTGRDGFGWAAAAIVALKSPLGDLRYELLSDPESPFFSPGHPLAGDTININHQHICGFGSCYTGTLARSQRSAFGMWSSIGEHALDGRSTGDLDERAYHRIFRPEAWPQRTGQFNKYVPGVHDSNPVWDYNHDGVPDTIYADPCGSRGCVDLWSDTLPSGYVNNYGNISTASIGPFSLKAGDTTALVLAFVGAADSAGIEASINNTIDFYKRFYLGPEAAPAPALVQGDAGALVGVSGGSIRDAQVTLVFGDDAEDWVDPFLSTLDVSSDVPLNPWLPDSIDARATNNVAAIHIFRSCDGGTSYSSDEDCDGDPISDPTSKWAGFGWAPYATIEATASGSLPNTFTDDDVSPGISYTYVIVTETRGATFNLVRGSGSNLAAETVTFAPKLISSLSAATTNPNVAQVYIPLNLAAGTSAAAVNVTTRTGFATVPFEIDVLSTAPKGGSFRAIIVDSVVVRTTATLDDKGKVSSTQTGVTGMLVRTNQNGERVVIQSFNYGTATPPTLSGLTRVEQSESGNTRVTVWEGERAMLVVRDDSQPLLVSTTLTGDEATPGSFFGRPDFPFFTISVDADEGGEFEEEVFLAPEGDTIADRVSPSVELLTSGNVSRALPASQFGVYELVWAGQPFGPNAPFSITDRAGLPTTFQASIQGRQTASTSTTSAEALAAVKAADPSVTLKAGDLKAFNLPFSVRNKTYDRDVQVLVAKHQESIVLGQGFDTLRVNVPDGAWVPGDVLYFVETVTREATDAEGNTIIGADGQPVLETATVATTRIVLGCLAPRSSCDPTVGGRESSGFNNTRPGTVHQLIFSVPFSGGEQVVFNLTPAVSAAEVAQVTQEMLNDVHVVPNPYIFGSAFERTTTDRVLKFTNLPPEGRIRIYDVGGRFVQQLSYTAADLMGGDLAWDLTTREGLELSYGLYVWVLESQGQRAMGKFVVIR